MASEGIRLKYETDGVIILVKDKIVNMVNSSEKLMAIESYARVLNQLLEAKQREVNIEHIQKQIPKI